MKKTFFTALCLLCCTFMTFAQESAMLDKIEQANAAVSSIESHFVQTQTLLAKNETVKSEGTLYLSGTDKMAMHYAAPSTDLLIINGTNFFMNRGKQQNKLYNTAKNKTMRQLSNTLLYCVHGKVRQLAEENNSELTVAQEKTGYVVTLTAKKKQARGYSKIVLTYDPKALLLTRMQMDEFNGNSTLYEMSGTKANATINASVYDIPKK